MLKEIKKGGNIQFEFVEIIFHKLDGKINKIYIQYKIYKYLIIYFC